MILNGRSANFKSGKVFGLYVQTMTDSPFLIGQKDQSLPHAWKSGLERTHLHKANPSWLYTHMHTHASTDARACTDNITWGKIISVPEQTVDRNNYSLSRGLVRSLIPCFSGMLHYWSWEKVNRPHIRIFINQQKHHQQTRVCFFLFFTSLCVTPAVHPHPTGLTMTRSVTENKWHVRTLWPAPKGDLALQSCVKSCNMNHSLVYCKYKCDWCMRI